MELSSKNVQAITLFVFDLERSKRWYADGLGLEQVFEDSDSAVFRFANTIVNLLIETAAPGLVAPAPVGHATGPRFQLTVGVDDVDAAAAEIGERIAVLNGPMNRPWGPRTVAFADPDGHVWELAGPQSTSGQ